MKKLLTISLIMIISTSYAQDQPLESAYDFWVGEWIADWGSGETKGSGTNTITKKLDDKVINEDFKILEGQNAGFLGTSISVYNPNTTQWQQAWADNSGGFLNFIGEIDGEKRIFKTLPIEKNGKIRIQRMVFYDIQRDSFTWDWEGTQDGGQTWNLLWRINYKRKK
jgi:hypothetical protein